MVVTIFPTLRDDRYSAVKKLCCVDSPVPSQVSGNSSHKLLILCFLVCLIYFYWLFFATTFCINFISGFIIAQLYNVIIHFHQCNIQCLYTVHKCQDNLSSKQTEKRHTESCIANKRQNGWRTVGPTNSNGI